MNVDKVYFAGYLVSTHSKRESTMNIFVLDTNPAIAAQLHLDKHVVKMPLETAQILSTICGGPYRPTHRNHPCTVWARQSKDNYHWLVQLGFELCKEYSRRYSKRHKCKDVIEQLKFAPDFIPDGERTPFVQAMPDECKRDNAVEAYKTYYRLHKRSIASWKNRDVPEFMRGEVK